MTRSVAIIGAGQIAYATSCLFKDDWEITLCSRSEPPNGKFCYSHFQRYTAGEDPAPAADLVIDTIAFDGDDIARYDPDHVGHLITISSASVYCDQHGRTLDEAAQNGFPNFNGEITEDQATVPPGPETYSTRKVRMENRAFDLFGDRATVLRPCAIYGSRSRHPREWWFVKRMLDGRERIPLLFDGRSKFQTTNAQDIASSSLELAEHQIGGVFNIADEYCPTVRQIGEAITEEMRAACEFIDAGETGMIGRTPWSVPRPLMCSDEKLRAATGGCSSSYNPSCGEAVRWLCEIAPKDWRAAFPQLAAYPWDMFDYEAEDRFLAST